MKTYLKRTPIVVSDSCLFFDGGKRVLRAMSRVAVIATLLVTTTYAIADSQVVILQGMNNIAVDRSALQNAINSAPDGSTLLLKGTFQLDGQTITIGRSNLTIQGQNEQTLIKGLLDVNGLPQGGPALNRGFSVGPVLVTDPIVENITIKNLSMVGHHRTIALTGTVGTALMCFDYPSTISAGTRNIQLKNLNLDNNRRGPQNFGATEGSVFDKIKATNNLELGIILAGGSAGCHLQEADARVFAPTFAIPRNGSGQCLYAGTNLAQVGLANPQAPPANGQGCAVTDEDLQVWPGDGNLTGLDLYRLMTNEPLAVFDSDTFAEVIGDTTTGVANNMTISNSSLAMAPVQLGGTYVPFAAQGENNAIVIEHNVFDGGTGGLRLTGNTTDFLITHNLIKNAGVTVFGNDDTRREGGIRIGASGYHMVDNHYQNNIAFITPPGEVQLVDVWLTDTSHDNIVDEKYGTKVLDQGVDNTVIITPNK